MLTLQREPQSCLLRKGFADNSHVPVFATHKEESVAPPGMLGRDARGISYVHMYMCVLCVLYVSRCVCRRRALDAVWSVQSRAAEPRTGAWIGPCLPSKPVVVGAFFPTSLIQLTGGHVTARTAPRAPLQLAKRGSKEKEMICRLMRTLIYIHGLLTSARLSPARLSFPCLYCTLTLQPAVPEVLDGLCYCYHDRPAADIPMYISTGPPNSARIAKRHLPCSTTSWMPISSGDPNSLRIHSPVTRGSASHR